MTTPLHEFPTTKLCESCGASIFFVYTEQGGKAPLDARPSSSGSFRLELRFRTDGRGCRWVGVEETPGQPSLLGEIAGNEDLDRYVNHYETCPDAEDWRTRHRRRGARR